MRAAGKPASQPIAIDQMRARFAQLADDDPAVRDAARFALMGLKKAQLEWLKSVVVESRPLAPAQAAALHDIVVQVWLASQPYAPEPGGSGFMGVRLEPGVVGFGEASIDATGGAVVGERIRGFAAFRSLLDGDVIVGVRGNAIPIDGSNTLITVIKNYRAGDTVYLKVSRAGRITEVPLTLDPRPAAVNDAFNNVWVREVQHAEEYWEQVFVPVLRPSAS